MCIVCDLESAKGLGQTYQERQLSGSPNGNGFAVNGSIDVQDSLTRIECLWNEGNLKYKQNRE